MDSELEASKSKCGNLLSSGSKDSEKGSGFYELHSRLIPGPLGRGEECVAAGSGIFLEKLLNGICSCQHGSRGQLRVSVSD